MNNTTLFPIKHIAFFLRQTNAGMLCCSSLTSHKSENINTRECSWPCYNITNSLFFDSSNQSFHRYQTCHFGANTLRKDTQDIPRKFPVWCHSTTTKRAMFLGWHISLDINIIMFRTWEVKLWGKGSRDVFLQHLLYVCSWNCIISLGHAKPSTQHRG